MPRLSLAVPSRSLIRQLRRSSSAFAENAPKTRRFSGRPLWQSPTDRLSRWSRQNGPCAFQAPTDATSVLPRPKIRRVWPEIAAQKFSCQNKSAPTNWTRCRSPQIFAAPQKLRPARAMVGAGTGPHQGATGYRGAVRWGQKGQALPHHRLLAWGGLNPALHCAGWAGLTPLRRVRPPLDSPQPA